MADGYRIIGAEMSPYSVKVRSYFRYKGIPFQWIPRNAASQAEFEKYAKMPIIPLVVTLDGTGIQDSTPIIDRIEKLHPRAVYPSRRAHHKLHLDADRGVRRRMGQQMDVSLSLGARDRPALLRRPYRAHARAQGQRRGACRVCRTGSHPHGGPRLVVGSNELTASQIEIGFQEMLALLEDHLSTRPYLFGGTAGFRRLRPLGTTLRTLDRSDRRRPDRRQRAACARLDPPHAVAAGRRRVRNHGRRWRQR